MWNSFIEKTWIHNKEIEDDKIKVNYKINSIVNNYNIIGSIKKITSGFSRVILKIKPDLIFLPADRYEILAAANVALLHKIPIAHYGGVKLQKVHGIILLDMQ